MTSRALRKPQLCNIKHPMNWTPDHCTNKQVETVLIYSEIHKARMQPLTTCLIKGALMFTSGAESTMTPARRQVLPASWQRCCSKYMPLLEKAWTITSAPEGIKRLISISCFSTALLQKVVAKVRKPRSRHHFWMISSCSVLDPPQPRINTHMSPAVGFSHKRIGHSPPRSGDTPQAKGDQPYLHVHRPKLPTLH